MFLLWFFLMFSAFPLSGEEFSQKLDKIHAAFSRPEGEFLTFSPDRMEEIEKESREVVEEVVRNPGEFKKYLARGYSLAPFLREALIQQLSFAIHQEGRRDLQSLVDELRKESPKKPSAIARGNPSQVVTLSPAWSRRLVAVSRDGNTLRFTKPTKGAFLSAKVFPPGGIIVGGEHPRMPEGFVRRILSCQDFPDEFELKTVRLTLDELLAGRSAVSRQLGPQDVESVTLEPVVLDTEMGHGCRQDQIGEEDPEKLAVSGRQPASDFRKRGRPATFWQKAKESAIFSSGISLNVTNSALGVGAKVKIENPVLTLTKEEISFRGLLKLETGLSVRPAKKFGFKKGLLKLKLNPIPLGFCGVVPIYIRPTVKVVMKGRVDGTIGFGGGFAFAAPLYSGIRKSGGKWKNISEASIQGTPSQVKIDGNNGAIGGKVFLGAYVSLLVNDLAGPTLRSGVYVSFQAVGTLLKRVLHQPPLLLTLFKIKGGAEVSIGGVLEFFKNAELLLDVVRVEIPLYKMKYRGIELDPCCLQIPRGTVVSPEDIKIWPMYQEKILGEKGKEFRLAPLSGAVGTWTPAFRGKQPQTFSGGKQEKSITCSLPLVDQELAALSATLILRESP